MDQLADLQATLNANPYFNGQGQTYEVAGDLCLPDNCLLENIKLIQLDQTSSRRTIKKMGGCNIRLRNVKVDRGPDQTIGDVTNSAGIWIANVNGVVLDDLDVTGNGPGSGIFLYGLTAPNLGQMTVHDMQFSAASDPGTEQIVGIWMSACSRFALPSAHVSNMLSVINGVIRPYQTDGIDASGCLDFSFITPFVSMCGEGIDISGSSGNSRFSILGGHLRDIDSWGVKLANSAASGIVSDVIVLNAGFGAFVVSGASQANLPHCENNKFISCRAINTGSNGRWSPYKVAGFSILASSYDQSYPMGVQFFFCEARDTQGTPTMKYGFRAEPTITATSPNKIINCNSYGHTVSSTDGNWA